METVKELVPIKQRVTKMQNAIADLVIDSPETLKASTTILAGIKDVLKNIKMWKDERIKPIKESIKKLEGDVKPFETNCKEAEMQVKRKMIDYNDKVEKERIAAEVKEAKKVEKGSIKIETAQKHLDKVPEAESHVKGEDATATFKKIKKFEVVDLSKLPLEYHVADEVAIRKAMNAGTELEGVRYYEETNISSR